MTVGATLLAPETTEMETHMAAERDCEIAVVDVKVGGRTAAKGLLVELKAAA